LTATRVATLGVLALGAKKKRPDAVTLVLTGDDYAQVVDCGLGPRDRAKAELFAGRVNAIRRELENEADADGPVIAAAAGSVGADPLAQITQLAELKDTGAITLEESEAKKAELLNRL
jgi:glyoxylase-like metal-dependent hydrolase (beta-lactamase superfamily II)